MSVSRLAAAGALLCSAGLANAAPELQVNPMEVYLSVGGTVALGPTLSDEGGYWSTGMFIPVQPGSLAGAKVDDAWDVQLDQMPGGGGSERSAGFVYANATTSHTVQAPANGPWSLTSQARLDTASQWVTQDGNGDVTTSRGTLQGDVLTVLWIELDQPAIGRFSGSMFLPASGSTWGARVTLYGASASGVWEIDNGYQSFEAQWVLQPGRYIINASVSDFEYSLPCCHIAYGGSGGWTYTLEIDALPPVPEPASLGLLLAGLAVLRQRTRQPV